MFVISLLRDMFPLSTPLFLALVEQGMGFVVHERWLVICLDREP